MKSGEFKLWGAFDNEKIVGVIATKPPLHIALLFVDKQYNRRGIARKMFETVIKNNLTENTISVNSSPYAVEIYHSLGFVSTDITDSKRNKIYTYGIFDKRGWRIMLYEYKLCIL